MGASGEAQEVRGLGGRGGAVVLRPLDRLAQALRDLRHAESSVSLGDYEWACFAAHQAAEKALEAVYQALGREARGHDLVRLLRGLREAGLDPPAALADAAAMLDKHYVAARHPDAYTEGYPGEHYTPGEAGRCVEAARALVGWARGVVEARAGRGPEEGEG